MNNNIIGLDKEQSLQLTNKLNLLLADYQILYMNVRGFHWNIKGRDFYELHTKFEEIYNNLIDKVDEIAERILTLEGAPSHGYSRYLEQSELKEVLNVTDGKTALGNILESYQILLIKQRDILTAAGDLGDEGTASLMSDYISEQEKETWMMASYLK
ncbi:DNA starvation/stationary phase protection protein [Vibrio sp. S4M6]|uniref:Dps family protein n=1 Tax=Vibrio sinus TaxID=2946865 RepID=UPI002029F679|nr:Dps family protein [Vibrio sinus]MCL9782597.1 DNA starvation/stationary phase protection protein [Vibrio sinus]